MTRAFALSIVAGLWMLPLVFLIPEAISGGGHGLVWWVEQRAWQLAARTTFEQSLLVTLCAAVIGWTLGVFTGLASSAWRTPIQLISALPLLFPPFLWAIGWSFLRNLMPLSWHPTFDGKWGMLAAGLILAVPIVVLATSTTVCSIRKSEWDFARVSSGPWRVRWRAAKRVFPVALATAAFGALLGAADAGAGMIMGKHGLAGEVLVSLASRQALGEAATKAALGTIVLLPFALIAAWPLATTVRLIGRTHSKGVPEELRMGGLTPILLTFVVLTVIILPLVGIIAPLERDFEGKYLKEALALWRDSFWATFVFGFVGGLVALGCGMVMACILGTSKRIRLGLTLCILTLAVPSSLRALGWVTIGSHWLPFRSVLDSDYGVACLFGIQWFPLVVLILIPPIRSMPKSWRDRRNLTGTSTRTWLFRVVMPAILPWCGVAFMTSTLLILSDVTSLMLLQPPGSSAFSSHLFAVMDNSMEVIVASLCVSLALIPIVVGSLVVGLIFIARRFSLQSTT